MSNEEYDYYQKGMIKIYNRYLQAIKKKDYSNIIYQIFLNNQSNKYLEETKDERKVIDFISGMTDEMFLHQIEQ